MRKAKTKVNKTKEVTIDEYAEECKLIYYSFLNKGFSPDQAFELLKFTLVE